MEPLGDDLVLGVCEIDNRWFNRFASTNSSLVFLIIIKDQEERFLGECTCIEVVIISCFAGFC